MFEKLSAFLDSFLTLGTPGYDFILYHHGKPVFRRMNGFSDREAKTPMNGRERVNLYSCSKVITCTAALQLWEKGLYKLDDELCQYMPEFKQMNVKQADGSIVPAEKRITVWNLFTMTAGFSYDLHSPALEQVRKDTNGVCPTREAIRYLAQDPLIFQPGARWEYSLCHDVLAAFVEVISGMPFNDYVKKNIFDPLKMTQSTFLLPEAEIDGLAAQYRGTPEGQIVRIDKKNGYRIGSQYASGGAGCVSTLEEYARFLEALRKENILLSSKTTRMMATPQLTPVQTESYWSKDEYGYGLGVRCCKGSGFPADYGWGGAAGSFLAIDPVHEISLFYMQHVLSSPVQSIRTGLTKKVLEEL